MLEVFLLGLQSIPVWDELPAEQLIFTAVQRKMLRQNGLFKYM